MTPHNANQAARELVRTHLERADIPRWGTGPADTGKQAGEFVVAMIKEIASYLEKSDA